MGRPFVVPAPEPPPRARGGLASRAMTRPVALITGATAGLGAAFVRALAAEGHDLVLVARDEERLAKTRDAVRAVHGVEVELLPADLADEDACARVEQRCAAGLDLLVNNAGLGLGQPFLETDAGAEERMLRVNVRAVMRLTHAALPPMLARGRGGVLNVSSVAGYVPSSSAATYVASKAYVTAFSESLASETAARGVQVTALCPGFTRTEFHSRAGMDTEGIPERLWLEADRVAAEGLADLRRGKAISVPGGAYKGIVAASRLTPVSVRTRVAGLVQSRVLGR